MKMITFEGDVVPQRVERDVIEQLLPHKGKMVLLSRVTGYSLEDNSITTEYDITKDSIFYEEGLDGIPSWAGFEIMAQSISTMSAIIKVANNQKDAACPGVILSVQNLKASVPVLKNNTTIQMKVKEEYKSDDVFCYNCALYEHAGDETPAVTTKITVMEMKDMASFLGGLQQNANS